MNCTESVSKQKYLSRRIDVGIYVERRQGSQPAQLPLGFPFLAWTEDYLAVLNIFSSSHLKQIVTRT